MYHAVPFMIANRASVARPRITSWFTSLRSSSSPIADTKISELPIGAAGFCWGAKYVVELCWGATKSSDESGSRRVLDVGFIAHPSMLSIPTDYEKVTLPLSLAAAEHDSQMSRAQYEEVVKTLEAKNKKEESVEGFEGAQVEHEWVWYPGANHGFAVRADEKDVEEAERGRKAQAQAVAWFGRWFDAWKPV